MTDTDSEPSAGPAFPRNQAPGGDTGHDAVPAEPAGGPSAAVGDDMRDEGDDKSIEAALAPLDRLAASPVAEHVAAFEEVLTGLETALTSLDEPAGDAQL